MSNYPPGVTGNEPQITGEWPCDVCGGRGWEDEDEDGKIPCTVCRGTGILPEDIIDLLEIRTNLVRFFQEQGWGGIDIDVDDDNYLYINTSLKFQGGSWFREE